MYVGQTAMEIAAKELEWMINTSNANMRQIPGPVYNVKGYGAKGDGVTDDTESIKKAYDDLYAKGGGVVFKPYANYKITDQVGERPNIEQLMDYSNSNVSGEIMSFLEGTKDSPNEDNNNPLIWVQKFTKKDKDNNVSHNIGAGFFETYSKGSGNAGNPTDITWISLVGNAVQDSNNLGTPTSQMWDHTGNIIGLAGFATANGYNGGITTGLWGYATTPELDDETFDNLPSGGFTTVAIEANVNIRHKDPGEKDIVSGHGTTVGVLLQNFQRVGILKDWTFGIALNGNNKDRNFTDPNVDNWNGFWTGILLDKIKGTGIKFGRYFKDNSYGIRFPDSFAGSQEPLYGIYMGNTKLNLGRYTGSTFNNRDMWVYDGVGSDTDNIKYRRAGVGENMFGSRSIAESNLFTQSHRMLIRVGGKEYYLPLQYIGDVT